MDFISVIILTVVNVCVCLALPRLLSIVLSYKQKPSLQPVAVSDVKPYHISSPEFAFFNENA
ncbi:MAG: hypothetical protein QNJ63_03595 [Calothrix sp. MO_192.B10]|nr:hypothetical protein [Calothrix sp. MO_192.B10]